MSTSSPTDIASATAADGVDQRLLAEPLSPEKRRVILLVNRRAGAGRSAHTLAQAESLLAAAGFELLRIQSPDELHDAAREASDAGLLRSVVAVGGDGTVGLALNTTPSGTPITVLPAGTENLLAKYLGQRARPQELAQRLQNGVQIRLDAGEANGRLFALMVSVGFDADVVRRVHNSRRGNITHLAYAKPLLDALRIYKYPMLQATWRGSLDGESGHASGRWLFGMNLPRYAQGFPISPLATGTDGLIDLCVFKRGYTSSAVWYLWHMLRQRHQHLPSVTIRQCQEFVVEAEADTEVPYQLDGDPGGFLPVRVRSAPGRLTCLVDRGVAVRLGFDVPASQRLAD